MTILRLKNVILITFQQKSHGMKLFKRPVSLAPWVLCGSAAGGYLYALSSHQGYDWKHSIVIGFCYALVYLRMPVYQRQ